LLLCEVVSPLFLKLRGKVILSVLASLLLISSFKAEGQKIKYKHLFVLLNAKNYEDAESFLRSFLADPKNEDEPNANLQMAWMLQSQAEELDIVNQTELYNDKIDTALSFFRRSLELIDEKEVKRHEEYYEDYFRRDLRSGKMGIKLSDIHLDIENSIEDLSTRSGRINQMKYSYLMSIRFYDRCLNVYERMIDEHQSYNQLLLRGRIGIVSEMDSLQIYYDSLLVRRENYFNLREDLEKFYKRPIWDEQEIKQYEIALRPLDLQADLIKTWDFKSWAVQSRDLVINETRPLQQSMVDFEAKLVEIENKLASNPDTLSQNLSIDMVIINTLMKYDNDAIPIKIFNYRFKKLEYLNEFNAKRLEGLIDTVDLQIREQAFMDLADRVDPLEFIFNSMSEYDEGYLASTYENFFQKRYVGTAGFAEYLRLENSYIADEKQRWQDSLAVVRDLQRFIWYHNEKIALAKGALDSVKLNTYTPVISIDSISGVLSSGFYHSDSDSLLFYFVATDGSQLADTIGYGSVDSVFQASPLITDAIAGYNSLQEDWVVLYYLKEPVDSTFYGTLYRFGKHSLLAWSKQINMPSLPVSLEYIPESLRYDLQLEVDAGEEPKIISLATDGSIITENQ